MSELRVEKLTRNFGERRVLNEVSFQVATGQCLALLGPSGAGKSTILRIIAGLDDASSGRVVIDGRSVDQQNAGDRGVAMAFQSPALLPQLSVEENLSLGPRLRRLPRAGAKVRAVAERLGLHSLLSRRPETLSGGEQQRVALGRALVAEPRVLLLDEPLANLDPLARVELREIIHQVQVDLGLTTLYVTHDQAEAAAVADRIALLRDGTLQQVGAAPELYSDPSNLFVARFFGLDGLNVLPAHLKTVDNRLVAEWDGQVFGLLNLMQSSASAVQLAFRPSSARIVLSSGGGWQVTECRNLGWTTVVHLQRRAQRISVWLTTGVIPARGDFAEVQIDPSQLLVFDPASGNRILRTGSPKTAVRPCANEKPA